MPHPLRRLPAAVLACLAVARAPAQCAVPPLWSAATAGSERVDALVADGAGGLYAGGTFAAIGGVAANCVAHWDGAAWTPLGSGMAGGITGVSALLRTRGGQLVAAGTFTTAGGVPAANIARWNGSAWAPVGGGIGAFGVFRLAELANGDLVALGNFTSAGGVAANNIARFDGTAWAPLGGGVFSPGGMLVRANGDLVVGGSFAGLAQTVARWTGSAWAPLGSFAAMVPNALVELGNGDLLAGGYQTVQRWNGIAWSTVGTLLGTNLTTAYGAAALPDGSALVVGSFTTITGTATATVRGVARWLPATATWSDYGSTTALAPLGNAGLVGRALALADGRALLFQVPALASGTQAAVVEVAPGCPATAVPIGTGCAGSGGANALTAVALPWLGTTAVATCSGVPAGALAVAAWGTVPIQVPLAAVLPSALPTCLGLVVPDLLTFHAALGGSATASLPLPADPALAGIRAIVQMVVLEATGVATSSNGLDLLLGAI